MGPCVSEDTAAETKHLWITDLQPHSSGTGAWWESLALQIQNRSMSRSVIKVLSGQPHACVYRY